MGTEDSVWIFDSLVGFLNGPVWQAPIQTFIEENCHAFETQMKDEQSHKSIFEEYRNSVDLMLGSYMEDIGITHQQFEEACNIQQINTLTKHFEFAVFEQIWAANDYELFKRMMIQRNLEIQLQTLQLMNQQKKQEIHDEIDDESKIKTNKSKNGKKIEMQPENRKYSSELMELPPLKLREEKGFLEEIAIEEPSSNTGNKLDELENEIKSLNASSQKNKVSSAEIRKRQEYLRAQRDKLVALKKEERKKKLSNNFASEDNGKKSVPRPKSAKAAQSLITGQDAEEVEQQLKIRKHLAQRLREELINNKE